MKILYLEDHKFFASEVIEYLEKDKGIEVGYASTYDEAERLVHSETFDGAILDVILQNGKTGFLFAENYKKHFDRILFVTGCIDDITLSNLSNYSYTEKTEDVFAKIDKFIEGKLNKGKVSL